MKISYKNKKIEKECTNISHAKKKYNEKVAEKLLSTINAIKNAETLQDIICVPSFRFHSLRGDKNGKYAIDLGKKSGYRLIVVPLNENDNQFDETVNFYNSIEIVCILVEEVSNHYE